MSPHAHSLLLDYAPASDSTPGQGTAPPANHTPPASTGTRIIAALSALGTLALLLVAAGLDAMPTQVGTHTQLGFPPCRWITQLGLPCPTCGMTTAYTNAVHGNIIDGFLSQPFGFILAIGTAMVFWLALFVLLTGSHVYRCVTALWKPGFVWALAAMAFLSWIFKIWRMTSLGDFS